MHIFILKLLRIFPDLWNKIFIKLRKVKCGKNLMIYGRLNFRGSGEISIGDNVTIHSSPMYNSTADGCITSLNSFDGATLKIGNNVGISHTAITAMKSVEICDNVKIGSNSMITDTDFHPIDPEKRIIDDEAAVNTKPVKIEKNVFIGARSIILKGVTIGENSVVGAGSVVTKSIPAGEIWAGNPAKFIKKV